MENKIEKKRLKEQETVELMIRLYCKGNHKDVLKDRENKKVSENQLCEECLELLEYSKNRSEKCPFMENKTFCNNCKVHCYSPYMREKIKDVMRYSGPRMIFHHPVMALQHVYYSVKEKKNLEKSEKEK